MVTVTAPITPDSWTFTAASQNYIVIGLQVNFNGAGPNVINQGGTNTITNFMTGAGISVSGGQLTVSGINAFTATSITGGTFINSGQLTTTATNSATFINDGILTGSLSQTGGTSTNNGTISGDANVSGGTLFFQGSGTIGGNVNLSNAAATFDISGTAAGGSAGGIFGVSGSQVVLGARTLTITNASPVNIFYGTIAGTGGLTVTGGVQELGGTNTYTGVTTINTGAHISLIGSGSIATSSKVVDNGTLDLSVTNTNSAIKSLAGTNSNANLFLGSSLNLTITNANDTYAGKIQSAGNLVLASGNETLTGANSYTGTTTVNGGTLRVDGTIASSSMTTVNTGGTLSGVGTVGNLTVNGGTFAPGNGTPAASMAVAGSLTLSAAATYLVQVNPTTSSAATVSGTATLGGATVSAQFAAGSYVAKQYTILTAGNVSGTFNPTVLNGTLPSGFQTTLSYDSSHAYLNLALSFAPPSGSLNGNQQSVGNAIINFFNSNGSIPIAFGGLTPAGLSQLSGEVGSAPQQTTFNAMSQFMGLITDPFVNGRGDGISAGGSPNAYADESLAYAGRANSRSTNARDAYAAIYTKAPVAPIFEQRWSVWAAGFGGSQATDGNAVVGSTNTTSNLYGTAVGADYRISRDTLVGFALAGGGTNFTVANALGGGRSDLFQAGAFFRHNIGPAYIAGALAYGWQDITTDRTVTVAGLDRLRAEFNANAYSGRLEGGYRFVTQGFGWTPYAAAQFTTFDLPVYAEQAIVGSNQFALAYAAKSVTDPRTELGLRTDKSFAQTDGVVTLRGRLAWAHDYTTNRAVAATFQTLPGASFVVNGAAMAPDSALVTAAVEKKWLNGWSAAGTFEGEFSNVTKSYAGKGVVRYAW
ncbi:hypothetical protein XH88_30835 [Bradyrhizobium sp. CCBAU 51627]|nr:hypothetical protein [Bradyrhizobium sp. CCBAU 51627]